MNIEIVTGVFVSALLALNGWQLASIHRLLLEVSEIKHTVKDLPCAKCDPERLLNP